MRSGRRRPCFPTAPTTPDVSSDSDPPDALATALRQLLAPLARLALAQGVTHATLDELMKQALVAAADAAHDNLPPHRRVSRITTATGIHRREVGRLVGALRDGAAQQPPNQRSHASELFAHWRSQAAYRGADGQPAALPRQGPAPSFESLAQAITRDVHPRSLLDELLRLGLAEHDTESDLVRLVRDGFVPQGDTARMLQVLGRNVGAHLAGAVDNVLHDSGRTGDRAALRAGLRSDGNPPDGPRPGGPRPDGPRHFEQAIFAGGLSEASLAEFRRLVTDQWQATLRSLVPALEALIERDAAAAAAADATGEAPPAYQQVRLGLYTHAQPDAVPAAASSAATPTTAPSAVPTEKPDAPDPAV